MNLKTTLLTAALAAIAFGAAAQAVGPDLTEQTMDEYGLPLVSVRGNSMPIEMIAERIQDVSGITIIARGAVAGKKVTVLSENESVFAVLSKIIGGQDWQWYRTGERSFEIMDTKTYVETVLPKQLREMTIVPENIKASELAKAIEGTLNKKIGESVTADDGTNKVFVKALPQTLEAIQKYVQEIDKSFVTRVFRVKFAEPDFIAEKIEEFKSDPGTITVDALNHNIIVRDLFRNIRRMEFMIDIYDQRPETRVYPLLTLDLEGTGLATLTDVLSLVVTPDAFMQFDENQGLLILRDVPEVHDDVEKLLAVFDEPAKQAMIHAEIVSTKFARGHEFGLEAQFSRDLFSSVEDGLFGMDDDALVPIGSRKTTISEYDENGNVTNSVRTIGDNLGFIDIVREFPTATMGAGGFALEYLNENVHVVFNAAMSDSETRVLSQPRIIVQNHGSAQLNVGGSVAYETSTIYNTVNDYRDSSQSSIPTGLSFIVDVSITRDDVCELGIALTNTDASVRKSSSGRDLVDTSDQQFDTVLRIPSGDTQVLGGLIIENESQSNSGVPFLYRIPYIGPLFGKETVSTDQRNLLIFITPIVLKEKKRERRPSVTIDELALLDEEARDDGQDSEMAEPDTEIKSEKDFYKALQRMMEGVDHSRKSDTSYDGDYVKTYQDPPELPDAVPAATPGGDDASTTGGYSMADPLPRVLVIEDGSTSGAPLLARRLEPLPRADHRTTGALAQSTGAPTTSFTYVGTGTFGTITSEGGVTKSSASGGSSAGVRPRVTPRPGGPSVTGRPSTSPLPRATPRASIRPRTETKYR